MGILISGNLYISTNTILLDFVWDSDIVSLIEKVAILFTKFKVVVKDDSFKKNQMNNKDILNNKNFSGGNF